MKLYRRPRSPYWWFSVTPVPGGPRLRISTKREDKVEALQVALNYTKENLDAHQLGKLPTMTLGEAVKKLRAISVKQADYKNVVSRSNKLIGGEGFEDRWHLKSDIPLHEITTRTVDELRTQRLGEGNKPGTINLEVSLLQRIYTLASKVWNVRVASNVSFPKFKVTPKLRYLTADEERRLLDELEPTRDVKFLATYEERPKELQASMQDAFDLVVFLLDTGARYTEVATIPWSAIDTDHWQTINIYRNKVGNEGNLTMTNRLRDMLKRRYKEGNRKIYVFPSRDDPTKPRGYAPGAIRRAIDRANLNQLHLVKRYGKVTIHTLRDTFASKLVMAGVSLYKVQKLLGHSDPKMTQKYAHLAPNQVADEAADVLNKLNGETNGPNETSRSALSLKRVTG